MKKTKKFQLKKSIGTISKEYEIIVPLTAEQKEIADLKQTNNVLMNKLQEMEMKINANEYAKSNEYSKSIEDVKQSNTINDGDVKSSAKKSSKSINE